MMKHLVANAAVCLLLSAAPAAAQALKGAGTCLDEYRANKPRKGEKGRLHRRLPRAPARHPHADRRRRAGFTRGAGRPHLGCRDLQNRRPVRRRIQAGEGGAESRQEKKKDFVAACRSLPPGTPTPVNGAAAAPAPVPSPAPVPAPAPSSQAAPPPSAPAPAPPSRAQTAPTALGESACANGYAHLPASHTAVQSCTDAEALRRCPGAAVVWVNTKSKVYHRAGSNTYGHTKGGAYMCESDATAEGYRGPEAHGH